MQKQEAMRRGTGRGGVEEAPVSRLQWWGRGSVGTSVPQKHLNSVPRVPVEACIPSLGSAAQWAVHILVLIGEAPAAWLRTSAECADAGLPGDPCSPPRGSCVMSGPWCHFSHLCVQKKGHCLLSPWARRTCCGCVRFPRCCTEGRMAVSCGSGHTTAGLGVGWLAL